MRKVCNKAEKTSPANRSKPSEDKLKLPHPKFTFSGKQLAEVMNETEIHSLPVFLYGVTIESLGHELIKEFMDTGDQVLFRGYRTKYNDYFVLLGEWVDSCFVKALLPNNAFSDSQNDRALNWFNLINLCVYSAVCEEPGDHALLLKIGKLATNLITLDQAQVGEAKDPALVAKERGASYQSGIMKNLAAWGKLRRRGRIPKAGKAGSPLEAIAIMRAAAFVTIFQELPTKTWLRAQLESEGYRYTNPKGQAASKWKDLFNKAGLATLQE